LFISVFKKEKEENLFVYLKRFKNFRHYITVSSKIIVFIKGIFAALIFCFETLNKWN